MKCMGGTTQLAAKPVAELVQALPAGDVRDLLVSASSARRDATTGACLDAEVLGKLIVTARRLLGDAGLTVRQSRTRNNTWVVCDSLGIMLHHDASEVLVLSRAIVERCTPATPPRNAA